MTDKDSTLDDSDQDDLDALMEGIGGQLADDLFDIGSSSDRNLDDELDDIASKLADDVDELDLGNDDFGSDDEAINLLDDEPSVMPSAGGLDYEDPDSPHSSFAEALKAAEQQQPSQPSPPAAMESTDSLEEDSFLDDDDPMLLLDEDLVMDKEANEGGILTIAALVLAILGVAVAGFATYQNMGEEEKIGEIATRLDNPPPTSPNPKIATLEGMVAQNEERLGKVEGQLHADAASLKDLDDRLALILEETRKDDGSSAKLDAIDKQLKGLSDKVDGVEKRIDQSQSQWESKLEQRQEALRDEFTDHLRKLATNPPPTQVTASTDPAAVQVLRPEPPTESMTALNLEPKPERPAREPASAPPAGPSGKGGWVANLASFHSERDAQATLKQLQRHGIFPKKKQVTVKGKTWYRLYVEGFPNMRAAQRYVDTVKSKPGLNQAWAGRAD